MDTQKCCASCGKPLPPAAPQGICPECLVKAGLGTGVDIGPETQTDRTKILFTPPPPAELAAHFPGLEILELIGQGGMGAVYKARQKELGRLVALKILPPQAVNGPGFAERFAREARALARLNHPNIVTLYESGRADGLFYFLMEYVDGINLQQLLAGGKIAPNEALAIVPQICDALQFAHQRGIVHRDIKPGNILLGRDGKVKIADFGVAKIIAEGLDQPGGAPPAGQPGELTGAAGVVGTPNYMAPEQVAHPLSVDHRADIYSLGVVFYQMLTGELPKGKFEPPSKKVVIDVRLDEVVLRALEKTPELRYQQAGDVKTQIETIAATGGTGVQSQPASNPSPGLVSSVSLNWRRGKIVVWGFALAAAGWLMPPPIFGISGVDLFVLAATLALVAGNNLKLLHIAGRLIAVEGLIMALGAIWCAFKSPELPLPWLIAIVAACVGAVGYCLFCWVRSCAAGSTGTPAWTRAQMAMVTCIGVLLAVGTGRVAIREFRTPSVDEVFAHAFDYHYLLKAPPVAYLRPAAAGERGSTHATGDRIVCLGLPLGTLMSYAYDAPRDYIHWSKVRTILGPGVTDGKYDFLLAVHDHAQAALRAEIRSKLGLAAHREVRETNVFILVVASPEIIASRVAPGGDGSDGGNGRDEFQFGNASVDHLSDFLERTLGRPVINGTELTQKYSGTLRWHGQADPDAQVTEIQAALASQFGLQLVPARQPVGMLVVEKVSGDAPAGQ